MLDCRLDLETSYILLGNIPVINRTMHVYFVKTARSIRVDGVMAVWWNGNGGTRL